MKTSFGHYAAHFVYVAAASFIIGVTIADLPALAQAVVQAVAPVATGGVDFGPLAQNIIAAAVMIATVGAGIVGKFVIGFLASKIHMQDSAAEKLASDRVNDILFRAIDYAEAWAKTQVADPTSQIHHVKIDNFFLAKAVEFSMSAMPDLIKLFGLTKEKLESMILSRLNAIMPVPVANSGSAPTFSQLNATQTAQTTAQGAVFTAEVKTSADAQAQQKVDTGKPTGTV